MFNYTHWYRKSLISDADVSDVLYIKVGSYVIMHTIGTCISTHINQQEYPCYKSPLC